MIMTENKCCDCGHHHDAAESMSKYDEALALYDTCIDDAQVKEAVKKIIVEKVHDSVGKQLDSWDARMIADYKDVMVVDSREELLIKARLEGVI